MLGAGEAPAPTLYAQLAPPPVASQPHVEQPSSGVQDQTDNDPTSQPAVDKESEKDSSGLVRATTCIFLYLFSGSLEITSAIQVLPLARIKRIIKSEGDVKAVSSEASFAVARAAVSTGSIPSSRTCLSFIYICLLIAVATTCLHAIRNCC